MAELSNIELLEEIDSLKAALFVAKNRLDAVEEWQSRHLGIDWGRSTVNTPHPNISAGTIESGGGIVRQDGYGMQIAAAGAENQAIHFVDVLRSNPNATNTTKAYISGYGEETSGSEQAYIKLATQYGANTGPWIAVSGTVDFGHSISLVDTMLRITNSFATPATLTANVDNYSPGDFQKAIAYRLSSDASRNITGISSEGGADRILLLLNIGANDIVLKNEDASSDAENRLALTADITLGAGAGVALWYDSTSSRWRCFARYSDSLITAHTGDTSDAHDASAISIADSGGYFIGTDAEAALQELGASVGSGGAPTNADYLVGTANGSLSNEIVVGTSPGGELGGTWASPTVDATHSGSAHTDFIAKAFVDAKGDLITATAADTPSRLAVGANRDSLVADSGATNGIKWLEGETFNVKFYGATGDGSTDDTTAIQAAIDAANTAGGGTVFFPEGTYISTLLTMYSNVHLAGVGPTATTIKLKNSTNTALIQGYDFTALSAGDTTGGISDFSIRDMTLDGNKANNGTTGYGIRVYGYRYVLRDLHIKDFFTNGIYSQWASAASENMEARLDNVRVYSSTTANGDGSGTQVYWLGPHDSVFTGCFFFYGDAKGFEAAHADKAAGLIFESCHAYGSDQTYGWYLTGNGCSLNNCVAEGAITANVYINANNTRVTNLYCFAAGAVAPVGVEVATGIGGYSITGYILNCTSNAVKLTGTDGGNGYIDITGYQTSGAAFGGTAAANTDLHIRTDGNSTGGQHVVTDPFTAKIQMKGANLEMLDSGGTLTSYLQASDGALVWGSGSDVNLYRGGANFLQTDDQFYAGDGIRMKTKAGVPTDADTTVDADGVIIIDTTNSDLYCRIGGTWKKVTLA